MEVSTETAIRSSCRHVMMPVNEHVSCAKRQVRPLPKGCKPWLGWRSCWRSSGKGNGSFVRAGCVVWGHPSAGLLLLTVPRGSQGGSPGTPVPLGLGFCFPKRCWTSRWASTGRDSDLAPGPEPQSRVGAAGTLCVCVPAPRQRGSGWIPQTRGAWAAPPPVPGSSRSPLALPVLPESGCRSSPRCLSAYSQSSNPRRNNSPSQRLFNISVL